MSKPKVDGSVDPTHLKAVDKTLSDGLRLGLPKPIIIEASSLSSPLANSKARGIGGKPACGRGFRVHNLTRSSHGYLLMWRATSRGGVSSSSKHVVGGLSAQTMEPLLALLSSPKAPVAILEGFLKGDQFSPLREVLKCSRPGQCCVHNRYAPTPRQLCS